MPMCSQVPLCTDVHAARVCGCIELVIQVGRDRMCVWSWSFKCGSIKCGCVELSASRSCGCVELVIQVRRDRVCVKLVIQVRRDRVGVWSWSFKCGAIVCV